VNPDIPKSPLTTWSHASVLSRYTVRCLTAHDESVHTIYPFFFRILEISFKIWSILRLLINPAKESRTKVISHTHVLPHVFTPKRFTCISTAPTGLSDHEISSQVTMMMFAGYETSNITLSFLAYNLATNPEVMKRLLEEIDSTFPDKVKCFSAFHLMKLQDL